MDITYRLWFFGRLYKIHENPEVGMWLLFLTVVALAIIVFKLGFARKLSLWKNVIVYGFLIFGCTLLTALAIFMPLAESLAIAAIVLIIYKLRLKAEKKAEGVES